MKFFFNCAMLFFLFFSLSSCTTVQVSKDVQSGRAALEQGRPEEALTYFAAAARRDPSYTTRFTLLNTGILTYIGRAYYEMGEKEKALASLKRAKDSTSDDYFARIYLGLVMSQNGKEREGMAELDAGLEGLGIWLESLPGQGQEGQYWDPAGHLQKSITETRSLLREESINLARVNEDVRWLGKEFEAEIDEVRHDIGQISYDEADGD